MIRNTFPACLLVFCVMSFTNSISAQSLENNAEQKNDDKIAALMAQIDHLRTEMEILKRRLDESETPTPMIVALPFPDTVSKLADKPVQRHCKIVMNILVDPKDEVHANNIMDKQADNVQSRIQELFAQKTTDALTGDASLRILRRDIQKIVLDEMEIACTVKLIKLMVQ